MHIADGVLTFEATAVITAVSSIAFYKAIKTIKEEDRYFFITTKQINSEIIIKFKDSANGIDNTILPKIFEPYFTTKSNSNGTGLGLFMTRKLIIQGMHGSIKAKNVQFFYDEKNLKGCEFIIKIPL